MPEYKFYPGPDVGSEYATIEELLEGFRIHWQQNAAARTFGFSAGETGGTPYKPSSWVYAYNAGSPYFALTWIAASGPNFVQYYRFNPALIGTVDAGQVTPKIHEAYATYPQEIWNEIAVDWRISHSLLMGKLGQNLLVATISSQTSLLTYRQGPKAGQYWGMQYEDSYLPSASEYTNLQRLDYRTVGFVASSTADDGTIGWSADGGTLGESQAVVPVLSVQTGTQQESWGDLSLSNLGIAGAVAALGTGAVTAAADVAAPGALALVAETGTAVTLYNAPGALATIAASGGALMLSLATTPAIVVGAFAGLGALAYSLYNADIAGKAGSWLVPTALGTAPPVAIADTLGEIATTLANSGSGGGFDGSLALRLVEAVERIADSQEAIQAELCYSEGPPLRPGIVNAVELASQARSEITLRSHGQLVTCSTGSIEEV